MSEAEQTPPVEAQIASAVGTYFAPDSPYRPMPTGAISANIDMLRDLSRFSADGSPLPEEQVDQATREVLLHHATGSRFDILVSIVHTRDSFLQGAKPVEVAEALRTGLVAQTKSVEHLLGDIRNGTEQQRLAAERTSMNLALQEETLTASGQPGMIEQRKAELAALRPQNPNLNIKQYTTTQELQDAHTRYFGEVNRISGEIAATKAGKQLLEQRRSLHASMQATNTPITYPLYTPEYLTMPEDKQAAVEQESLHQQEEVLSRQLEVLHKSAASIMPAKK